MMRIHSYALYPFSFPRIRQIRETEKNDMKHTEE